MSEDEKPLTQLAVSLSAMLAVAVVLGLVLGGAAVGAFRVVGGGGEGAAAEEPSLSFPTRTPEDTAPPATSEVDDGTPGSDRPRRRKQRRPAINLTVNPVRVSPMERINLSGTYRGGDGATLQVQRFEDGWRDFPTTASVSGRTFATYVMTGRSGRNRFRVVDEASGKRSNPVTVRVG
jgi:hypothetical protein